MTTRNLRGGIALGSLTATVALLAGLSSACAQGAPGAGSFPRSFLIPGTNTSLAVYGRVLVNISSNWGSQHVTDTSPAGIGNTAFAISGLALDGPGAGMGAGSYNGDEHATHGGLRAQIKSTQVFFETRTPSDLGEIKTVVMMDFGALGLQSSYVGRTTSTSTPSSGAGNNEVARVQFAYGTIGPWLIGQYLSAYMDPLMFTPGVGDQSQIGLVMTRNVRRPQIRYTYLAGNGVTLSASLETHTYSNLVGNLAGRPANIVSPIHEDSTDVGGITNYPSFNAGIAWTQPWGHVMTRFGIAENEVRSSTGATIAGSRQVKMKKLGWAVEAGIMLNTWGHDQWRGLVNYSAGADTFLTDEGDSAYIDGTTGSMEQIKELAFITSYKHVFSPNWFATAEFSMGFFNKPSNTSVLSNVASGTSNAGLAGIEKRHLQSALSVGYMPLPGKVLISLEWDHWNRWVQASNTSGQGNRYGLKFFFFW